MKNDNYLPSYLKAIKESYSDNQKELNRRLEWVMLLSEETYKEEIERRHMIDSLTSSLLLASSFLVAGFISFICAAKYGDKNLIADNKIGIIMCIICAIFASFSIFLQLFLIFYKKRVMSTSIISIAQNYLDKSVEFGNDYSENYGRILTLNKKTESLIKLNNSSSIIEKIAIVLLAMFLIFFVICFFVI